MRLFIIGIILLTALVSCATDDVTNYEVGSDFLDDGVTVRVIDSFTINTGSFKLDSLVTSSTNRILLGHIEDDKLGGLTSQSYFQLSTSIYEIDNDAVYDSIGFIMNYDTYYYGDTTKIQTYKIHEITETFSPEDGDSFYNTSSLEFDSNTIGELSFTPRPNRSSDSLYIPLNDVFGEEIFNKIQDNDINSSDDLLQQFKGLTIIPDETTDSHVLGFNVLTTEDTPGNCSMRLYYTIDDGDGNDNDYYIDFVITDTSKQFNNIISDLSSSIFNEGQFEDGETIIETSESDNLMFSQAGSGITSRIEIPSIKKLKELSEFGSALSAELTFNPLKESYTNTNSLQDSLLVYIIDHKNRIQSQLTTIDGVYSYAILNQDDNEFNSNTYYSIDLSGYVDQILYSEYDLNYALMIQYIDFNNTVNNTVIEDQLTSNQLKLSVKYLNY